MPCRPVGRSRPYPAPAGASARDRRPSNKQPNKQTNTHRKTNKQTNRQTNKQTKLHFTHKPHLPGLLRASNSPACRRSYHGQAHLQQTAKQTSKQTNKQTDKQTNKQPSLHKQANLHFTSHTKLHFTSLLFTNHLPFIFPSSARCGAADRQ